MATPEEIFSNPFFHSLLTEHAGIAIGSNLALRFPADVIPFASLAEATPQAMQALHDVLAPGERIYVLGDHLPSIPGLTAIHTLPVPQMHPQAPAPPASSEITIRSLNASDAPAMVHLTDVAFPTFFRPRAHILGDFFGIHHDGELVAMAGERIALPGFREISALCTHPAHTGKGYAAHLLHHLMRHHAAQGLKSFLHVSGSNTRAISLYERLGFTKTRTVLVHELQRS
ncbi:GNAT family N-acetyltransferase [Granulicella sibirica]|uniref:Acetyltransferase n=1 Tax=Granulicella sibirica TaxID=2479048 RepID=A0A4Q0T9K2_9BACT|nr:GNAT family N-acetyltransferase [Granulicella sibirica]RXH58301.1 Acetyltransferase [Granulicella sibirica]